MSSPQPDRPALVEIGVYLEGRLLKSYRFSKDVVSVGSGPRADIRIKGAKGVLPQHLTIVGLAEEPTLVVRPGASVTVAGEPTDLAVLGPEDEVGIGRLRLRVRSLRSTDFEDESPTRLFQAGLREVPTQPRRVRKGLGLRDGTTKPFLRLQVIPAPPTPAKKAPEPEPVQVHRVRKAEVPAALARTEPGGIDELPIPEEGEDPTCFDLLLPDPVDLDAEEEEEQEAYEPHPELCAAVDRARAKRPEAASERMVLGATLGLAAAVLLHLVYGVVAGRLELEPEAAAQLSQEESFAEVALEMPEAPPPEPPVQARAEVAPRVSSRAVKTLAQHEAPAEARVDRLLTALAGPASAASPDLVSDLQAFSGPSVGGLSIGSTKGLDGLAVKGSERADSSAMARSSGTASQGTALQRQSGSQVRGKVTRVSSAAQVSGSLSAEEVSSVIAANLHQVQGCYEKALVQQPDLGGRLVLDWTVTQGGAVTNVRVRSSSLGSPAVADCVAQALGGWRFPSPRGGDVVITYPFLFRSVG